MDKVAEAESEARRVAERPDSPLPVRVGAQAVLAETLRFDVGGARRGAVHALRWTPPSGAIVLHHAMMFATAAPGDAGPVPCEPMPVPVAVLPLYAPGDEAIAFPEGVSIAVPEAATGFFVQLHLSRVGEGAGAASVDLLAGEAPQAHLAGWVDDTATVPALVPHASATSIAQCRFLGPVHIVGSWPHMHRLGAEFHGTVVRADGRRDPLLDVPQWDFYHQRLYPVGASLGEGDAVETACTWNNTTAGTVKGGPFSTDEMCNQGLVIWPRDLAYCIR